MFEEVASDGVATAAPTTTKENQMINSVSKYVWFVIFDHIVDMQSEESASDLRSIALTCKALRNAVIRYPLYNILRDLARPCSDARYSCVMRAAGRVFIDTYKKKYEQILLKQINTLLPRHDPRYEKFFSRLCIETGDFQHEPFVRLYLTNAGSGEMLSMALDDTYNNDYTYDDYDDINTPLRIKYTRVVAPFSIDLVSSRLNDYIRNAVGWRSERESLRGIKLVASIVDNLKHYIDDNKHLFTCVNIDIDTLREILPTLVSTIAAAMRKIRGAV